MVRYICVVMCAFAIINGNIVIEKESAADLSVKSCVKKMINTMFTPDETLYLLYKNEDHRFLPIAIPNPYVIVNMEKPVQNSENAGSNFVIQVQDVQSQSRVLLQFDFRVLWNVKQSAKGKYLFIAPITTPDLHYFFERCWKSKIVAVVLLTYTPGKINSVQLHVSNPFWEGNSCGKFANNISTCSCNESKSIKLGNTFKAFNGCPVQYYNYGQLRRSDISDSKVVAHFLIFDTLTTKINTSIQIYDTTKTNINLNSLLLVITGDVKVNRFETGPILYYEEIICIVPPTEEIPSMKLLGMAFTTELWLLIGIFFIIMVITWYLINRYSDYSGHWFDEISSTITDVLSMLFCGSVSRIPKSTVLCSLLILFLWYYVLIRTAFTGNIVNILTVAKYETPIKNFIQLADSQLCVLDHSHNSWYFKHDDPNDSVYSRLRRKKTVLHKKSYIISDLENLDYMFAYRNCAVMIQAERLKDVETHYERRMNYIVDNSVFQPRPYAFCAYTANSFWYALNNISYSLIESGIPQKVMDDADSYISRNHSRKFTESDEWTPLNLSHVSPIFMIYIVGCAICCVIFTIEVIIGYIKNKYFV